MRPEERIPMLGVHVCVCSFQGQEGQAMFRVRVCALGIIIFFFFLIPQGEELLGDIAQWPNCNTNWWLRNHAMVILCKIFVVRKRICK